jgi:rSAM/selenodomain-associated transferase 2
MPQAFSLSALRHFFINEYRQNKGVPAARRFDLSFLGCALGFLLSALCMAHAGPIGKHPIFFSVSYTLSFLFLLGFIRTFPEAWSAREQFVLILSVALVARLFFLAFPASFDVNRYVWEGYVLNHGFNPYIHPPDDPILKPLLNEVWDGINHKDATACYPPLAMLLFRLSALIDPNPLVFKAVMILFDMGTICALSLILGSRGVLMGRLSLYALNPLVLVFIAGEGHLDAVQVFFMSLCFYFLFQKRDALGFFSLGCAIMSKYMVVVIAPFLIDRENWKKSPWVLGGLFFYVPFWDTGADLFSSLVPFSAVMHYNDSVTVIIRALFGPHTLWVSALFLGGCLFTIFVTVHDPLRSSYLAIGCSLLFFTTLHPWYLVLITPFLLFFPSRPWLYLHWGVVLTVPVLYAEYETGVFQEIHWIKLLEYVPFYGLLIWEGFRSVPLPSSHAFKSVSTLCVVIPTLNESGNVARCLKTLGGVQAVSEMIVVDGGSSDGTAELARSSGARVITAKKGRGIQIDAGVEACLGDVVLVLHADCVIQRGTLDRVVLELNREPRYIGGAIGMAYDEASFKNRVVAWLNNARARWTGISFGDQAQFFRKEALKLIDGYPDLMLMEDVELAMRLKEHGPLCFIPKGVVASARRWKEVGFWLTLRTVVFNCLRYLIQRRFGIGDQMRREEYERYYERSLQKNA